MRPEDWIAVGAACVAGVWMLTLFLVRMQHRRRREDALMNEKVRMLGEARAKRAVPWCLKPGYGWFCTREDGHDGPCAAWPTDPRLIP